MKRLLATGLLAFTLGPLSAALPVATSDTVTFLPVLLDQPEVRRDLDLTTVQNARIDAIRAECRAKVGVVSAAGLLDSSLASSAVKDLSGYQRRCNSRVLSLLTADQSARLRQIERRFQGGRFLLSPSEQDLLKLTPDQRHKIAEIRAVDSAKATEIGKAFAAGKKTSLRRDLDLHRLRRTTARSILHILTPAQKKEWLSSLGTPLKK
jgi:hypothetical protein